MARAICQICGKGSAVGRSQKHKRGVAGKRWKKRAQSTRRVFRPNLQTKTIVIGSDEKQMRICTKCIKKIKKDGKIKNFNSIAFA